MKIKVLIADDSDFLRNVLRETLESTGKIEVIAEAVNGKEAIEMVAQHKPEILILDCEMPVMNGLEALRRIMRETPLPVLMFSSLTAADAGLTIRALEYGAVDFLLKTEQTNSELCKSLELLVQKLYLIAVRSRRQQPAETQEPGTKVRFNKIKKAKVSIIAIGSSTGGVNASMKIIPKLPVDIPPIVWAQHMPAAFTQSFAERLNNMSAIEVKQTQNYEQLKKGVCYLAPGGYQMEIKEKDGSFYTYIYETDYDQTNGNQIHAPSCDILFNSIAQKFSTNALGIILTGMGNDGAQGLVEMHDKGAFVIGQNEQSCLVYGMPRAAKLKCAVDIELDVNDITEGILRRLGV